VNGFAVSAKSYKGKIPARTGRPVFSYITTATAGSTVEAVSTSEESPHGEQHPKAGDCAKAR
jgi:hypothetical protein